MYKYIGHTFSLLSSNTFWEVALPFRLLTPKLQENDKILDFYVTDVMNFDKNVKKSFLLKIESGVSRV